MDDEDTRLRNELELLTCMYPDQVEWNESARGLRFRTKTGDLQLRIPNGYLKNELPLILSASVNHQDVRDILLNSSSTRTVGEEVIDFYIANFNELCDDIATATRDSCDHLPDNDLPIVQESRVTVIVWLHHLLNTNKRKQALSPSSPDVSGVTKPGYPGVLLYSGPSKAVQDHVGELKSLNWQAFQIRSEIDHEWTFAHGTGVIEVESMKDVVAEIGEGNKESFMEAMRMK